ncbi:MAG: IS630 family transposase [Hyphomicrobiales bacterium]|nr:IS630 family transposase [Hyphomicrobiales bacterium]
MAQSKSFSLTDEERTGLEQVLRQRKADGLIVRRANALLLLDKGWKADQVADALYLDAETIRGWRRHFIKHSLRFLYLSPYSKREGHLNFAREAALKEHLTLHPPRSTNEVRGFIQNSYGQSFSRSGAIKLMARLGFVYKKPKLLPLAAKEGEQREFIKQYNDLMNGLEADEAIVFGDAVHPEHQSRPAHGWFLRESRPAIVATSGRKRLNIHGVLNLEDGLFRFVEAEKINAETTRQLLQKLEDTYPSKRIIHVFLDNARYHHAKVLQPWLKAPERQIKLHFLPAYAPHLNPIERLWGVMHRNVTHSRHYAHFNDFTEAILNFFRKTLPQKWLEFRDTVTDNFRVITQENYKLIG